MSKIHLYFRIPPMGYKWIPGDRFMINLLKKLFGRKKVSGVEKVFINLCKGFDELNIDYDINIPFKKIKPNEPVIALGVGKYALKGYNQSNPIIAGIALMTHPSEWPTLFNDYPIVKYLQHSEWANNVYKPYYGADNCIAWPVGIETDKWAPAKNVIKKYDFLIYNKIRWDKEKVGDELRWPILKKLDELGLSYTEIVYGDYTEPEYFELLKQSKAMIFLCEHESQGFACCEALSMNVPVLAWDQGYCLDPNRFSWEEENIPATSVPYFDVRCGMPFNNITEFDKLIPGFWNKVENNNFRPREYILENLSLKICAQKMLDVVNTIYL